MKAHDAALLLRFGDELQRQRRLAGGLRPVDLDHAPARHAADAERDVEAEAPGRDRRDVAHERVGAELHDRALAEGLLDLADGQIQRALAIRIHRHVPLHSNPLPTGIVLLVIIWARRCRRKACVGDRNAAKRHVSTTCERKFHERRVDRAVRTQLAPVERDAIDEAHVRSSGRVRLEKPRDNPPHPRAERTRPSVMCGVSSRSSGGKPSGDSTVSAASASVAMPAP